MMARTTEPSKQKRTRRLGVRAIAALLLVGAGSMATRAVLRALRARRDRDRLRHAHGEPTERSPDRHAPRR
ncbi:MAG: hypothetical protein M5U28_25880 [Sandaracinaceae bacterium]|nr:hypothetical protein [Sandaracinaceae bacterium]